MTFRDTRPTEPPEFDEPDGPSEQEMFSTLDAYGHMQWTVGNEDWVACADYNVFLRPDDDEPVVVYHVVVDCESGGFCDIIESGMMRASELGDLDENSWCPLDSFVDICCEHYAGQEDMMPDPDETEKTMKSWTERLIADVRLALKMLDEDSEIPTSCCISDPDVKFRSEP